MPNYSSIQHSLHHIDKLPNALEIEWDSHGLGKVLCLAFDRLGKYCAIISDRQRLVLCSTEAILLPQLNLPLPPLIKQQGYNASFLSWSYDAYYLISNFHKRSSAKRKAKDNSNETLPLFSSVMYIWDVEKRELLREMELPFLLKSGIALPSDDTNQHRFLLNVSRDSYHQFMIYTLETGNFQQINESFTNDELSLTLSPVIYSSDTANTNISDLSSIQSFEIKSKLKDGKEGSFRLSPLFTCFPSLIRSNDKLPLCNWFLFYESNINNLPTSKMSVFQFSYSEVASPNSKDSTLTVDFHQSFLLTLQEDLTRTGKHRNLQNIIFSSNYDYFFIEFANLGISLYSFHENEEDSDKIHSKISIQKLIDFSFDSKIYHYYGIHFVNCDLIHRDKRYQQKEEAFLSDERQHDLLIMNAFHKIRNHSELIVWDYAKDSHLLNQDELFQENDQGIPSIQRYSLSTHPFQQLFPTSFVQPLPPSTTSKKRHYPLLFGIDPSQKLWSCSLLVQSDFAGTAFPIGYKIIHQVTTYVEKEDELDYVTKPKKQVNQSDDNQVSFAEEIKISAPIEFQQSVAVTPTKTYLRVLPFDISSFLFEESLSNQPVLQASQLMVEDFSDEDEDEFEEGDDNMAPTEKSSVYGETEGTNISDGDNAHQRKKKKRSIFPTSLDTYLPVPNRVATGDFINKLNREKQAATYIHELNQNVDYLRQKQTQLYQEALKNMIRTTLFAIRRKGVLQEKRALRKQNKELMLQNLLQDYDVKKKKAEEEKQLRGEVGQCLFDIIVRCEKRIRHERKKREAEERFAALQREEEAILTGAVEMKEQEDIADKGEEAMDVEEVNVNVEDDIAVICSDTLTSIIETILDENRT